MALTVQDIVNSVSTDMRQLLDSTGTDATLMIDWIDRIHKDVLHDGAYRHFNQGTETVSMVAGTGSYTLTTTNIRGVCGAFDRITNRELLDFEQTPEQIRLAPDSAQNVPRFRKLIGTATLLVFPAPGYTGNLDVTFDLQVTTLANLTDTLVVPEDGKAVMVAGVNYLTASFLSRDTEAKAWFELYVQLKGGGPNLPQPENS